nr:GtrA family protein [Ktedonobacteraceae bacterium]
MFSKKTVERQTPGVSSNRSQGDTAHRFLPWSSTVQQFLRYCLVGGVNTGVDLLMLNILLWCFPTHNVQVLVAYNSVAYSCGALSSFFLNKYWTFRRTQRPTAREVVRFVISVLLEVLYSNVLIWLAGRALQPFIPNITLWGNASKLVAVVVGAVLSYSLMRFWTFASGSNDRPKKQKTIHQPDTVSASATIPASPIGEHAHHHRESERTP